MSTPISERFAFDNDALEPAKIRVIGVGGGGGNAVNNMIRKGINEVEFIAINTDVQALDNNGSPTKIQIGRKLTKGLGAGARPGVGAEAAEESRAEIEQALQGTDMLFITAGMGGGTGTGAAPVVASVARKLGILTVAIVTKPFVCEGNRRAAAGEAGIQLLSENVDTLIVIPNERLLDVCGDDTPLIKAFETADDVLYNATRGISDLITEHGLINLDFADVRTTMEQGGKALMGSATASGENRAEKAAIDAISSPLLDGLSIAGAENILVNITAGKNLGIREATTAMEVINREAGPEAEVIFGTVIDENLGDGLRVTVIATGFDRSVSEEIERSTRAAAPATAESHYKGEENLKVLDQPAYLRRGNAYLATPGADEDTASGDGQPRPVRTVRVPKVRKIQGGETKVRRQRISKDDPSTPAFLRKMMD
ncbi:MAG: cell division protein FtsZ [Bacteroidota bacterium]